MSSCSSAYQSNPFILYCRDPKVGPPIFWDAEWYLILNTAVGGGWPGLPSSATVFPAYHRIDYVRVSQHRAAVPTA